MLGFEHTKASPIHYPALIQGHPLIDPKVNVLMPWRVEASLVVFELLKAMEHFIQICHIDRGWQETLLQIAQHRKGRVSPIFLDQLSEFHKNCTADEKDDALKSIIYHIYSLTSVMEDIAVIEEYCPNETICDFSHF